ncbi:MAG: hypothetical protein AVDCRST_MAG39-1800 [uncultured Sphingomonadaceae bacterium]|uniref:Peptidase M56 domain-containing protein n=1 Tax=uncultured Sphingomonadaceae bacterium TaxID=169976 RepID=A0A6J4SY00_9SPHN|nr:MAG: hypothetical protein AVDCRST_MAG39-1800 [uncultured Sphingomonadaceae bacterium]
MEGLLLELAWKSVVTSGGALLLLQLLRRRTAAERSLIAHAGLVATLLLPLAVILLPAWSVDAPVAMPAVLAEAPLAEANSAAARTSVPAGPLLSAAELLAWSYALPAALLLITTVAAVARLFVLRARAVVLVDMPWLSALAHAQRRMGFKHGTALLMSDDLVSPVSWGLMRPVILLDSRAVAATHEAEAIIAHELAHVARLDWAKLLAARLATALFWFNPLVWKLAAECHQLREEAADDAVLHSQVDAPDYASLLVGAARHENQGLLLAAHGVAPGRSSLSRRVARVLDRGLSRAPARRTWALAWSLTAVLLSAPLAALTPVAPGLAVAEAGPGTVMAVLRPQLGQGSVVLAQAAARQAMISDASGTSAAAVVDAAATSPRLTIASRPIADVATSRPTVAVVLPERIGPTPAAVAGAATVAARATATAAADEGSLMAIARARNGRRPDVDAVISRRIHNVTPEYVAALTAANPRLRGLSDEELVAFRIHAITPEYIRALTAAGYGDLSSRDLLNAKILGLSSTYVRELAALGYRGLSIREITSMRMHGVTSEYVRELRRAGINELSPAQLVKMRIFGVDGSDFGSARRPAREHDPSPPDD